MAKDRKLLENLTDEEWNVIRKLITSDTEVRNETITCPHCRRNEIVKNGVNINGRQRYLCRNCHKSFVTTTGTLLWNSNLSSSVWNEYLNCMQEGLTLEASAVRCGISTTTSFYMRHKVIKAIMS